jgi:formate hydrogenlyase subunit 6/NADH:ubiquinone oxidoreductase subunit I
MPHFIMDNCIGCAACSKMCPTECISGEKKELFIIDSELCIDCGICGNVCPVEAIIDNDGTVVEKKKITKERTKARVIVELCSGCVFCVDACPYNALEMVNAPDNAGSALGLQPAQVARVIENKCTGCRICEEVCIKEAVVVDGNFTPEKWDLRIPKYENQSIGAGATGPLHSTQKVPGVGSAA